MIKHERGMVIGTIPELLEWVAKRFEGLSPEAQREERDKLTAAFMPGAPLSPEKVEETTREP